MVSRETESKTLRVRLLKLANHGWDFALNSDLTVRARTGSLLQGNFEEFVSAVLGLNSAQLIDDLAALRKWTDPDKPLPELLAGAGSKYAKDLLNELTGIDPGQAFEDAKGRVIDLLDCWDALPHDVASRLWSSS